MHRKNLSKLLKEKKLSIAIAESCTGGIVSKQFSSIPGASGYFKLGIVAYSPRAKNVLLGVPMWLIQKTNGVCPEIAQIMAKNVARVASVDIGASIVGFAGPSAPRKDKLGLVFMAVAFKGKVRVEKEKLQGSRLQIMQKASHGLIDLIYEVASA